MRIVSERDEVLEVFKKAGESCTPVICPNAETPDEMEGLLLGASVVKQELSLSELTLGMGITAGYPSHPQLSQLSLSEVKDGQSLIHMAQMWLKWLHLYSENPLFPGIKVIPFIDHGWADLKADVELMEDEGLQQAFGIILFDASMMPMEENKKRTADYVARNRGRVVVEACPDKVYEHHELTDMDGGSDQILSQASEVAEFVSATGVDLIVPNLGTEHRTSSTKPLTFEAELCRQITEKVGPISALHGTSSLGGNIKNVGRCGIVKINIYTGLARAAATSLRTKLTQTDDLIPLQLACGSALWNIRREAISCEFQKLLRSIH